MIFVASPVDPGREVRSWRWNCSVVVVLSDLRRYDDFGKRDWAERGGGET